MSDESGWDGIVKYRWTDPDNGEAVFDASDEIGDGLKELVEEFRGEASAHMDKADEATSDEGTSYGEGLSHAFEYCADELEQVLEDG